MYKNYLCKAAFLALISGSPICFGQQAIDCPATVKVASAKLDEASVPAGSEPFISDSPVRLSSISAFNGPPTEGAALIPRGERTQRGATIAAWLFEGPYPHGKYVSCDYANGFVRVVTRVNDVMTRCTGTTRITQPYRTLNARFDCR
jgi:hypothetical protein